MTCKSLDLPKLDKCERQGLAYYTDTTLEDQVGVKIAFTTTLGGVSENEFSSLNLGSRVGDSVKCVNSNQDKLLHALSCDVSSASLFNPKQVHGDNVITITSVDDLKDNIEADAAICNVKDVGILLCFADCTPLIFVAPNSNFCVVHAGWRGVANYISQKSLKCLSQISNCRSSDINIYIGPNIHVCCFEVGEDVKRVFENKFTDCIVEKGDKAFVDMNAALKEQLVSVGANAKRICDVDICTKCNCDEFFSYRASGGKCGRHGAFAIWD